jgi:sterol desaturase/sphingolipid hydroxylase (fatty acid hydroxylase superfamily)
MFWVSDGRSLFLSILLVVLLRYAVIAGLFYYPFYVRFRKRLLPGKLQPAFPRPKDYLREIGYSLVTVLLFTAVGWIVFGTSFRSLTMLYTDIHEFGIAYFILSIPAMLVIHDTYFYWMHRAIHHPRLFPVVHRVHHLSTNPSPWAAFAFHPAEAVLEALIIALLPLVMPVHPLALSLFLLVMMIYNAYGHLGWELYPRSFARGPVGKWINTSVSHNQHHAWAKGNYGLYFLWWDRWMGTLREDYGEALTQQLPRITEK